jgi:4-aminobutyrate--pyruvate transaminase
MAPHFQKRLRSFALHPLVGEARGVGLIGALELVADKQTRANFDPTLGVGAKLVAAAEAEGVILRAMAGDAIAFSPPLIITESEIDEMFARFAKAFEKIAAQLG